MWTLPLWSPPVALSPAEQKGAARAVPRKKLFVFLREIRGELFDDAFQEELLAMYRQTGAGKPSVPAALLAMVAGRCRIFISATSSWTTSWPS